MAIADSTFERTVGSPVARRALTVLGGLLVAALIAYCALELIQLGSRHTFDVRTDYGAVHSLEVDSDTGDIRIATAPAGSDLVVVAHVTEGLVGPKREALHPSAGVLHLASSCPDLLGTNVCGISYTITVPAGVPVNASSGDGDVIARGLTTTAPLKLTSENGEVSAVNIRARNVTLRSGNGDVTATLSQPATRIQAISDNGDVNLTVPNTTYAVRATSSNGSVSDQTLKTDPHAPRSIVATSGNGDVTVVAAGS